MSHFLFLVVVEKHAQPSVVFFFALLVVAQEVVCHCYGITGVVASTGVFALSQCGGATVDAAHEDILIAVLVGENASGRGDALNIGQARLVRVLTQVPDNLPKADEGVIVQERGAVTAVFPNQFFKGIPRNFICNEDAKCASGPPNIGKSALKRNCELYERSQRLSRMVSIVQSQLYPTRTKMQMFNCPHGKMYA